MNAYNSETTRTRVIKLGKNMFYNYAQIMFFFTIEPRPLLPP